MKIENILPAITTDEDFEFLATQASKILSFVVGNKESEYNEPITMCVASN